MIEEKILNKAEFYTLLETCPDEESDALIDSTRQIGLSPHEFFESVGIEFWGILINDVPVYFGCLYQNGEDDNYHLWTLSKANLKEQFTLFKLCKRKITKIAKKYNPILAANYVKNKTIAKWNMRMGFLPYKVENDLVYYKLGG